MVRVVAAVLLVSVAAVPGAPPPPVPVPPPVPSSPAVPAIVRYGPPVPVPIGVVRAFEAPATRYAAGHRGVDLAAAPGTPIRAAGAGRVTFAGTVAGRGLVVVSHPDGLRTEYEPVRPAVGVGAVVERGALLGGLTGMHGGCRVSCLHWGVRRGDDYVDPLALTGEVGEFRLKPWGGGP